LLSTAKTFPLTLYKFGRPNAGTVLIEFAEIISEKWLDEKRQLILEQIEKISKGAKARRYKFIET
jgi:hypothetical protein